MANSADPDQLASSEANWSGSTLFAKAGYISGFSRTAVKTGMFLLFSPSYIHVCCGHLLKAPEQDASKEYQQHPFLRQTEIMVQNYHQTFLLNKSSAAVLAPDKGGWSGVVKVSCILRHQGLQLILAYSWARLAILHAGKGRRGMFLFLLFLHFHSCSSFFPVLLFHLLYHLFSPFLWEKTQNDPQGLTCR